MNSFWLCLIGFVLMAQSSTALRCHSCNSQTNADCLDASKLPAAGECNVAAATATVTNALKNVVSNVFNVDAPTNRAVCQKTVTTVNNVKIVDRSCSMTSEKTNICDELRKNKAVEACEICETDSCNSAISMNNLWLPMILMPAFAAIFKTFA